MRKEKALIIFLFDVVALAASYVVSYYIARYASEQILNKPYFYQDFFNSQREYYYIFYSVVLLLFFLFYGHYTNNQPWWLQVKNIFYIVLSLFAIDGFGYFITKADFSRTWLISSWSAIFIFVLLFRQVARIVVDLLGFWTVKTAIIGNGKNILDVIYALNSDKYAGYNVTDILVFGTKFKASLKDLPKNLSKVNIVYGERKGLEFISRNKNRFYIIAPEALREIKGDKIVSFFNNGSYKYSIVPPTRGLRLYGQKPQFFFGYDLMLIKLGIDKSFSLGKSFKRVFDIVLSVAGIIILSPLLLGISFALLISGNGIFYSHKRVGKNNNSFYCMKFKTMYPNADKKLKHILESNGTAKKEWLKTFKLQNDPRITPVGNFLRKTSLDELPQLLNVLKGDMSIVGPRPITKGEKKYYGDVFSDYCSVRPGITGLWQVNGRNDTSYDYRVYLDSWYVNNWSIWHDIVIVIKTIRIVLKRTGAY